MSDSAVARRESEKAQWKADIQERKQRNLARQAELRALTWVVLDFDQTLAAIECEPSEVDKSLEHIFGGARRLQLLGEWLAFLHQRATLAIVSFNRKRAIFTVLRRAGWLEFFVQGGIHGAEEIVQLGHGRHKGHFLAATVLRQLQLPTERLLFVDDNSGNIEHVAKVAGCPTIWVPPSAGGVQEAEMQQVRDWVEKLTEVKVQ